MLNISFAVISLLLIGLSLPSCGQSSPPGRVSASVPIKTNHGVFLGVCHVRPSMPSQDSEIAVSYPGHRFLSDDNGFELVPDYISKWVSWEQDWVAGYIEPPDNSRFKREKFPYNSYFVLDLSSKTLKTDLDQDEIITIIACKLKTTYNIQEDDATNVSINIIYLIEDQ